MDEEEIQHLTNCNFKLSIINSQLSIIISKIVTFLVTKISNCLLNFSIITTNFIAKIFWLKISQLAGVYQIGM